MIASEIGSMPARCPGIGWTSTRWKPPDIRRTGRGGRPGTILVMAAQGNRIVAGAVPPA